MTLSSMPFMRNLVLLFVLIGCISCDKDDVKETSLSDYIESNQSLELSDLIACAGGKERGLFNVATEPTSVFFYPIDGASDFKYFETTNLADSLDFSKYIEKDLDDDPIFNGYLWKFNNTSFSGERMGVVTYKTPGKLHVCTPIRLKTNVKPTEVNSDAGEVIENGLTPTFTWEDGIFDDNVIYFQIISDAEDNLISGTYTFDKNFTFYDLSNVVLNITDSTSTPTLNPNQNYKFTMMGVSEDNWVNLLIEKEFSTN